jgi:uncharacterized protein YjbI with pentapeptide repeats
MWEVNLTRRVALCIGINEYLYAKHANLNYARPDAESLSRVFSDKDRGNFECITLLDREATKEKIVSTFNQLLCGSELGQNDFVLVYYSGHGGVDESSNLYLVAHDSKFDPNDPTKTDITSCIHTRELEISLDLSKVGTIVLIIDACYSGASGKALTRINFDNRNNIFFVGASRHNEASYEVSNLGHGLFTSCFLEGLNEKPSKGEWVTLQQLLSFINSKMREYIPQVSEVTTRFVNTDILIAKNPFFRLDTPALTNEVKDLFSLSKAQIVGNNYSSNFFISKQSIGPAEVKTGVLCLDNRKTEIIEGAIDNFLNLIQNLRSRNRLDRGLIVTERSIDLDLASKIDSSDTSKWLTKDGLIKNLMDFEFYLKRVVNNFDNVDSDNPRKPALASYCVPLMVSDPISGKSQLIMDYVKKWASSTNRKLAILGEYGFGKTVFCKKLSHDMSIEYLSNHKGRIPIVFNLRKFPRIAADLPGLIINHLAQNCGIINPSWAAFERMNNAGLLMLIFDGLDEMAVRTNREVVEQNLFEIEKLAFSPISKIIITSRPEYFWTGLEEKELLESKEEIAGQQVPYEILRLAPFNKDQIKDFLQKRIPLIKETKHSWTYYYERILNIYDLPDLSKRPVFLEMISETLPKMIEENIPINRYTLYETYINMEIKRQEIEKRRHLLLSSKDRFKLMQMLAVEIFQGEKEGLTSRNVLELMQDRLTEAQLQQLESHVSDFLSCSFLRRKNAVFVFSHQTFLEFLVSAVLYEEIIASKPYIFEKSIITEPILDFLFEKNIEESSLWRLIEKSVKLGSSKPESNTASNAISLLNRCGISLGKNLSKINLKEARLRRANLTRANLIGANLSYAILNEAILTYANLDNANLSHANLEKANMTSARVNGARFQNSNLKAVELETAILKETDFTGANLSNIKASKADFSHAILRKSCLLGARIEEANLQNVNLQGADLRCARLQKANLSGANLVGANLSGAILYEANLSEANLENTRITDTNLKKADLRGANLNTSLFDVNLSGIKFDQRTIISEHNIDIIRSLKLGYIEHEFAKYIQSRSFKYY